MAKSGNTKCPLCGEVQFTVIDDYKTQEGNIIPVIICDSCGKVYRKPKGFMDENHQPD